MYYIETSVLVIWDGTGIAYMDTGALDDLNESQRKELLLLMLVAAANPDSLGRTTNKRPHRLTQILRQAFNRFSQSPRLRR
jgi:hypothetical protein